MYFLGIKCVDLLSLHFLDYTILVKKRNYSTISEVIYNTIHHHHHHKAHLNRTIVL